MFTLCCPRATTSTHLETMAANAQDLEHDGNDNNWEENEIIAEDEFFDDSVYDEIEANAQDFE